jgi:SAM-dependent methyltransferase
MTRTSSTDYVHGYCENEGARLQDQATALAELLHRDTAFPQGSLVLEAGCGVGAQTVEIARRSPGARILSVDIHPDSLQAAEAAVRDAGFRGVTFRQAELMSDPFPEGPFDHVFLCFVLEHLRDPKGAVERMLAMLRPGGTLTVIEGDHGSVLMWPQNDDSLRAVACQVELQRRCGGDAEIGRRLYPLLQSAGGTRVSISPRFVYADPSRPELQRGFTLDTFTAMVAGVREGALGAGLVDAETWERGIAGLRRCAEPDGVFCYTFFRATCGR